jgi:acetylglutamate kinase
MCNYGDLVSVNGYHLAASVASALNAYKLVFMANEGSILHKKGGGANDIIQELPLSFAEEIIDFHNIKVHPKGFANFDDAQENLEPRGVELLLHLGWACLALENGVKRAHIVNPTDGALLEELFTSKNGANTCLYHDDELGVSEDDIDEEEWNNFFHNGSNGSRVISTFG